MDILFLGTSAAVPSRDRSTSCIALRDGSNVVLMDCGEGSQRQLMISPFSFMRIGTILITHLHGDHVFGLPGLIQTMGLSGRIESLRIYGPHGIRAFVESSMSATEGETTYPMEVEELSGGETFDIRGFSVECFRTDHGMASLGFVLRAPDRPGRLDHRKALELGVRDGPDMARLKAGETVGGVSPEQVMGPPVRGLSVAYAGDTKPCAETIEASRGVDVLIHEATYMESESARALEHNHSTAAQAAMVAAEAGVSYLIMTHISHRYDDRSLLEAEARGIFPQSYAAEDMELFAVGRGGITATDLRASRRIRRA